MKEPTRLNWDDRLEEADREFVAKLNAALYRLSGLRAVEIAVSGPFARSKIAWKLAYYQHALLHRIVALMDGTAVAWNARCALSAMLSVRAFMETVAVMAETKNRVASFLAIEDLAKLDALAQNGIFATRDAEWLAQHPESMATNILSYVEKFDKLATGFKKHYDTLSERCHPNAAGHNFMFTTLDHTDGTVRFADERSPDRNGHLIVAALAPLPLVETMMSVLDDLILKVSDLHHRISPVRKSTD